MLWILDVRGEIWRLNPKPETRNPKEIRNPKAEANTRFASVAAEQTKAPKSANLNAGTAHVPGMQLGPFGIRISAFLRFSAFGFRISALTRLPSETVQRPYSQLI